MKIQPYRSHWGPGAYATSVSPGFKRFWKQRGHRLFRRLSKEALREGTEPPQRISVDDGT